MVFWLKTVDDTATAPEDYHTVNEMVTMNAD